MDKVSKSLYLVFLDTAGKTKTLTLNNPKEDLGYETVVDVMQDVIDDDTILTASGAHLASIKECYYRTVTTDYLEPTDGE